MGMKSKRGVHLLSTTTILLCLRIRLGRRVLANTEDVGV